jgi:AAT family amino acid transporter
VSTDQGRAAVEPPLDGATTEDPDTGYRRALSARTVQMIALGGAIGTGLFYGSGAAIEDAGPALILCYAVAGVAIYVVMRALGEMLMYRPVAGSFADYAREFLGPYMGYAVGWTYWLVWITTCMAEITVAGFYVQYWWPDVPVWLTSAVVLAVLLCANLASVRLFGEAEFWFSMVKVLTIVGLILVGIAVLLPLGIGPDEGPSLTNLWEDGGVFPTGFASALLALHIVMFAYIGVELVGVTASEARDPKVTLRRAINTLPVRIGLFYIGALTIIMSVQSWQAYRAGESPFVAVFSYLGLPGAAGLMNLVLLTAALSSCNSGLFSTGRMLRTLSTDRVAPAPFAGMSRRGLPSTALVASSLAVALGILVDLVSPDQAFAYISSVAAIGIVFVWGSILVCHARYRQRVARGELPAVDFRLPAAPWTTAGALAVLALVVVLLGVDADGRDSLVTGVVWFVAITIGYLVVVRRRGADGPDDGRGSPRDAEEPSRPAS